jgi:RNA polymerase sigma-70 factor (ECF subfamily)
VLHEDATFAMPPFREWLQGAGTIGRELRRLIFDGKGRGGVRLLEARANGGPAYVTYFREDAEAPLVGRSIQLLTIRGDRVSSVMNFLAQGPALEKLGARAML